MILFLPPKRYWNVGFRIECALQYGSIPVIEQKNLPHVGPYVLTDPLKDPVMRRLEIE